MENLYKTIDVIVAQLKKDRLAQNFLGLLTSGEALLEYMPGLINHSIEQESLYRKFEAELANKRDSADKPFSNAYCETQAKATDYYKEWQKAKQFIELMYEMVNMAKALGRGVNREFNSQ